jgi:outer membrane protein assembly factor BamB
LLNSLQSPFFADPLKQETNCDLNALYRSGAEMLSASMAYVGTLMGKLFGINLKDGKISWEFTTESYTAHHLMFFKPDDTFRDDIVNFIKTPADFIGMEYTLGAIFSSPAITVDRMVFCSSDGTIYGLKK